MRIKNMIDYALDNVVKTKLSGKTITIQVCDIDYIITVFKDYGCVRNCVSYKVVKENRYKENSYIKVGLSQCNNGLKAAIYGAIDCISNDIDRMAYLNNLR